MAGSLSLTWHQAHAELEIAAYETVEIVSDSVNGQYELLFCSTRCMRAFLNACVDELEEKSPRNARAR
jgi:hypothetical protein